MTGYNETGENVRVQLVERVSIRPLDDIADRMVQIVESGLL